MSWRGAIVVVVISCARSVCKVREDQTPASSEPREAGISFLGSYYSSLQHLTTAEARIVSMEKSEKNAEQSSNIAIRSYQSPKIHASPPAAFTPSTPFCSLCSHSSSSFFVVAEVTGRVRSPTSKKYTSSKGVLLNEGLRSMRRAGHPNVVSKVLVTIRVERLGEGGSSSD